MSVPPELRALQLMPSWRGALQALRQDLPLTYKYTYTYSRGIAQLPTL